MHIHMYMCEIYIICTYMYMYENVYGKYIYNRNIYNTCIIGSIHIIWE